MQSLFGSARFADQRHSGWRDQGNATHLRHVVLPVSGSQRPDVSLVPVWVTVMQHGAHGKEDICKFGDQAVPKAKKFRQRSVGRGRVCGSALAHRGRI